MLGFESLESRRLLAVAINEFPIPTADSFPIGITTGSDGNLWFTEDSGNRIGRIDPTTHAIAEFPIPTAKSEPQDITHGPDGNLWFTEVSGNQIGQLNPTTHAIAEFPIPTAGSVPHGITTGPDGNLWFTESFFATLQGGGKIGMINPTTHAVTDFSTPTVNSQPEDITRGPDGNLWFTETTGKIGTISPTTHAVTEFTVKGGSPFGITRGPDGNLWFTDQGTNGIGEINPTTHAVTEFPIPTAGSIPAGITTGPDGNLWFTDQGINGIGEINPTTHAVTETPTPTANSQPASITRGPDGNLWFTESSGNRVGRVVLRAVSNAPDLSLGGAAPGSVTLGQNVTYTFTVANDGTAGANGVTLTDTLPSGATFVSATGGVMPVNGALRFAIGTLAAGARTTVTVVVTPTAAGTLTDSATARMSQTDPTPADNSVTRVTTVTPSVPGDGPSITLLQRFGYHRLPTTLVLSFNQPLNPVTAQNPGAYRLTDPHGRTIAVLAAVYHPSTRSVTLSPARRLDLHLRYLLTVSGTGPNAVTSVSGLPLDGGTTGQPGSDYMTPVTAANWVRPPFLLNYNLFR